LQVYQEAAKEAHNFTPAEPTVGDKIKHAANKAGQAISDEANYVATSVKEKWNDLTTSSKKEQAST